MASRVRRDDDDDEDDDAERGAGGTPQKLPRPPAAGARFDGLIVSQRPFTRRVCLPSTLRALCLAGFQVGSEKT